MACLAWRSDNPYSAGLFSRLKASLPASVASPCCLCWLVALRTVAVLGGLLAALVGACRLSGWRKARARMYTVRLCLCGLAAIVLSLCRLTRTPRLAPPTAPSPAPGDFALLSVAAALTHYNMVFVLIVCTLGGWFGRCCGPTAGVSLVLVGCGLVTALLVLPMAPIAMRQIPGYKTQTSLSSLAPNTCVVISRRISAVTLSILPL